MRPRHTPPLRGRSFSLPATRGGAKTLIPTRPLKGVSSKAGNSRCRHVLVQASWHYRHRPAVSTELGRRQRGQPPAVVGHAGKAQHHLYKLYHRIAARKASGIAAVAVARELVGFLWAVMQELQIEQAAELSAAA